MEFKTTDTESIASIIKAIDDAKKKDSIDKLFDWLMRLAMAFVIWFCSSSVEKFEKYGEQLNDVSNRMELLNKDNEYTRVDMARLRKDVEKLTEGK